MIKGQAILGKSFFQTVNYIAQGFMNQQGKELDYIKLLQGSIKFNYLVGVINNEEQIRFKRIIFQIPKGNVWIDIMDINNYEIIDTNNLLQLNIIQEQFKTFKKCICSTGEQIIFFTSELVKSRGFVGAIRVVFGYSLFSLIIFDVLMMMDVMECSFKLCIRIWLNSKVNSLKKMAMPFRNALTIK